jgi:putative ABC transport system permease protein
MRFADYILLAIKNLFRQTTRTILTIVAITVGSLSVILMMSLIISIRQSIMNTLGKMGAFTLVSVSRDPNSTDNQQLISGGNNNPGGDEGKKITDTTVADMKKIAHVVDATPIMPVQAKTMRLDGSQKKQWSSALGYDPASNVLDLPLLAGRALSQYDMDKVVVGSNFVETYGYHGKEKDLLGQRVLLTYDMGPGSGPDWGNPPAKPPQNAGKEWYDNQTNSAIEIPVEIVGIADNKAMDDKQNYVTLAFAKRLMTSVR